MGPDPSTAGAAATERAPWKRWCVGCLGCLVLATLVGIALLLVVGSAVEREERRTFPEIACFESIRPGMTEQQVRHLVGEPDEMYEKDTAPAHYYADGYSYEQRPISNKVLIYWYGADDIAYIWIGPKGRVEHVFLGGS